MLDNGLHRFSWNHPTRQQISLRFRKFRNNAKDTGIELQFRFIESHNPIGQAERYRHVLRRIFNIIKADHPQLDENTYLDLASSA